MSGNAAAIDPAQLQAFLSHLRSLGFKVGLEQHQMAQDVLLALAAHGSAGDLERLARCLGPIACTSPAEQAEFHRAFAQWFARPGAAFSSAEEHRQPARGAATATARAPRTSPRSRRRLAAATAAVALIAVAIARLFVAPLFAPRPQGPAPPAATTPSGDVARSAEEAPGPEIPAASEIATEPQIAAGAGATRSEAPAPPLAETVATPAATDVATAREGATAGEAATAGDTATAGEAATASAEREAAPAGAATAAADRQAAPTADRLADAAEDALAAIAPYLPSPRVALALAPIALAAAFLVLRRWTAVLARRSVAGDPPLSRLDAAGDAVALYADPRIARLGQDLRRPLASEAAELDVPATIQGTMEAGGLLTPVWRARTRTPEYLVLIDRAGSQDHQAQLLDAFAARLADEGVHVERLFYDRDPRVCESAALGRVTLDDLGARHPGHCLILMGDGAALLDPLTLAPKPWAERLGRWSPRALVTPLPVADWGAREEALESELGLAVLPATLDALLDLPAALRPDPGHDLARGTARDEDDGAGYPRGLRVERRRWLEASDPGAAEAEPLLARVKHYLGEDGWAWFRSCAVYPAVQWDLTLALAGALPGRGRTWAEDRLLRLASLPWFRDAVIPDWLRLRLVAEMPERELEAVRGRLRGMLLAAVRRTWSRFSLEVAHPERGRLWRRLRRAIAADERSGALRDAVFLDVIAGRRPGQLALVLPRAVAEVLPGGLPPAATSAVLLVAAGLLGAALWAAYPSFQPAPLDLVAEPAATPAPIASEVATAATAPPEPLTAATAPSEPLAAATAPSEPLTAATAEPIVATPAEVAVATPPAAPAATAAPEQVAAVAPPIAPTAPPPPASGLALQSSTPADETVRATIGDRLAFSVRATARDAAALRYAWTVDGKPAKGTGPRLDGVAVTRDRQTVAVEVRAGDSAVTREWQIAALPPLALDFAPARLDRLRFQAAQEFAVRAPAGTTGASLEATWTVDGRTAGSGSSFTLRADDPALVRTKPVTVVVSGRDADGRRFSHTWDVDVVPPVPQIASADPPAGTTVDVEAGQRRNFKLTADAPVGGQSLTYVFEVDGEVRARGTSPTFSYAPTEAAAGTVSAYVQDNFQQASAAVRWPLAAGDVVGRVRDWLSRYEKAWNARNAAELARLRNLDPAQTARLEQSLNEKQGLQVRFADLRIEPQGPDRAVATYLRSDQWTEERDGRPVSRSATVRQTFAIENGRVREVGVTQQDAP